MAKTGTIVIDPGHGGLHDVGGSSHNNAISASGVLEKNIVLRMAFLVREQLALQAAAGGHNLTVFMTRDKDVNLGLAARADVAKKNKADLFLSIHCNGFNKKTRGTETLISPASVNPHHTADRAFAQQIQSAVFGAISHHDAKAVDRKVKDQKLGVLKRADLGSKTRGCLLELEFIDVKAVDELLNIGPNSPQVRKEIAEEIAKEMIIAL
jgi:N-acetylmuramoyl-L-alanine amidase